MRRKFLCIAAIILQAIAVFAQNVDSVQYIDEVSISALKQQFHVCGKTETIDSLAMAMSSGGSLTDMINVNLPLYIKQDAGGLSTIRFRGASPDHTAIIFEGINLNSLTLGHSNASNISSFLFDEIKVQYGSSASMYGSGAVGGSIHLNSSPKWINGFDFQLQQNIGSFSNYFNGIKLRYGNSFLNCSFKLFRKNATNDFPFENIAVFDFEKQTFVNDYMKNLAISNYGGLAEIELKPSSNLVLFTKAWIDNNYHQIQPNMSANYYGKSNEDIQNRHRRMFAGFRYYANQHKLHFTASYINDCQIYNKIYNEEITTSSYVANFDYSNTEFLSGKLISGIKLQHIEASVYAYNGLIAENSMDIFAAFKKHLFDFMELSLNLREVATEDYHNNFVPSAGLTIQAIKKPNTELYLKPSVSRSFRTPSFNDRYWYPNGNPDILPEDGLSFDFSTKVKHSKENQQAELNISTYFMLIDNWIQWINKDMWRPINYKKVQSAGIEFSASYKRYIRKFNISNTINFSLNTTTEVEHYEQSKTNNKEVNNNQNDLNRQLMYTPKLMSNYQLTVNYNSLTFLGTINYTGERFTESYKSLPGYWLTNFGLNKEMSFGISKINLSIKANNVFDVAYQNQEWFAMPGRNYMLIIKYCINKF